MAITYTTTIQDRIAYKVWGVANSSLSAAQKALLDGTWTTGALSSGVAYDAFTRINQYAQWFNQAGATDAPSAWEQWFVAETCLLAVNTVRPDRVGIFEKEREAAIDAALDAFSLVDANGSTLGGQTITYKGIRQYVMNHCLRRRNVYNKDGEKFRLFVPPQDIDSATQWTLNFLWNRPWRFRKRQVTISITAITFSAGTWTESSKTLAAIDTSEYTLTAGDPIYITGGTGVTGGEYRIATKPGGTSLTLISSISTDAEDLATGDITGMFYYVSIRGLGSGESLDSFSTRELYYTASSDSDDIQKLRWASAGEMALFKAKIQDDTDQPARFRLERQGANLVWLLAPYPDDDYTLTGEAFVAAPSAASSSTDTAPFTAFPAEFSTVIRDVVLAKVLKNHNAPGASDAWQLAMEQVETLLSMYEEHGNPEEDTVRETRDVYGDTDTLGMGGMIGGGM